jgi:thiol-disulfide isomerase/thioredoxin
MKHVALFLALILALAACSRRETPAAANDTAQPAKKTETAAGAQTATGTDIGSMMPEYSAMWLDGSKFDLAGKRDKVVLLNVWATWCGPCRIEIPELQALHNKLAPKGFEVIGVSVDESGVESVRQFVTEQKMTYPVAIDPEGKLAGIFQTSVLPTSVLLDRTGKILWKHYGLIEPNNPELAQAIEKAL